MARFIDLLNERAQQEDLEALSISGIGPDEADDFLEKAYWESPEPAQIAAGQQNFAEPEKAEPLAKSVSAAKAAGQPSGIGVVPAIFAGLAGAFSDNGVATTSALMKKWDPRTQAAEAVERETKRIGMEGKRGEVADAATARQRDLDMRDADSDMSVRTRDFFKKNMPKIDVEGMSAADIKELMPDFWNKAKLDQLISYNVGQLDIQREKTEQERIKQSARDVKAAKELELKQSAEDRAKRKEEADLAAKQSKLGAEQALLQNQFDELEAGEQLINKMSEDWFTRPGKLGGAKKFAAQMLAEVPYVDWGEDAAKNWESADSLFKSMQQKAAKLLGVNPTDRDLQFIVESSPEVGKTPGGLKEIISKYKNALQNLNMQQFGEPLVSKPQEAGDTGGDVIDWNDM